ATGICTWWVHSGVNACVLFTDHSRLVTFLPISLPFCTYVNFFDMSAVSASGPVANSIHILHTQTPVLQCKIMILLGIVYSSFQSRLNVPCSSHRIPGISNL
uniref:Uncharacterized protein n=1 Tax=Zonotrichia albicollis TaxID=44394 RepID=A0A8D2MHU5_ZONAL